MYSYLLDRFRPLPTDISYFRPISNPQRFRVDFMGFARRLMSIRIYVRVVIDGMLQLYTIRNEESPTGLLREKNI